MEKYFDEVILALLEEFNMLVALRERLGVAA